MKFALLTLVVVLFVPGFVLAAMFILMINGVAVNVDNWLTLAIVATIGVELYGIIKIC